MDKTLIQEIQKRQALCEFLTRYISVHFTYDAKSRLKRGQLQKQMADFLGITTNTPFCRTVNECMEKLGYKAVEVCGQYYYKNIKRIE